MRLRLTKVDEYQLLTCIKHSLWGSKSARFSQWKPGDLLAVIVEHKLAALGTVEGKPFVSRSPVWDNGVFPHRIKVNFTHFIEPEKRTPVLGQVRDVLTGQWGPNYGWGIQGQRMIEGADAEFLAEAIIPHDGYDTILLNQHKIPTTRLSKLPTAALLAP